MKRRVNYKAGALKRKFKTGRVDQEPGTFINLSKAKAEKAKQEIPNGKRAKISFMGMV